MTMRAALDKRDLAILAILQREGRITKAALAERVNLSPAACWDRLKRLETSGLITGYQAGIAVEAIGPVSRFVVQIELENHRSADFQRFEAAVRAIPQVTRCVAVGGGVDYFLEVMTRDIDHYQSLIDRLLDSHVGVKRYFTFVVTKQVKANPPPIDTLFGGGPE
jgi:Lrp/AsnC family transcriptional regulator of ectoine degradation